jgi:hypothetical protein
MNGPPVGELTGGSQPNPFGIILDFQVLRREDSSSRARV